ncbi:MAG: SpoIIE family protein phosphatase [Spirochaetes bacterium]|nr:SpoIIE family protein phosphatase [Spirochaetota bacterium]
MTQKTNTIGFIAHDYLIELGIDILKGINDHLLKNNYNLISIMGSRINDPRPDLKVNNIMYEGIDSKFFDGFIIWSINLFLYLKPQEIKIFLNKFKPKPVIILQKKIEGYPSIIHNLTSGITNIMEHLVNYHKYKSIGFIRGPENHPLAQIRYETFLSYMKSNNMQVNENLTGTWNDWGENAGREYIINLLDKKKAKIGKDIDAIVCSNANHAKGVIKELKKRGYVLPKDIAITGYNDDQEAHLINPSITLADPGFYEMGTIAADHVLKLIKNEKIENDYVVNSKLIIRNSCGCIDQNILNMFQEEKHEIIINDKIINSNEKFYEFINKSFDGLSKRVINKLYALFYFISKEMNNTNLFDTDFHFFVKDIIDTLLTNNFTPNDLEKLIYNFFIYETGKIKDSTSLVNLYRIIYYIFVVSNLSEYNIIKYEQLIKKKNDLIINNIGLELITNHGLSHLIKIISDNFPLLDIDYISLFLKNDTNKKTDKLELILSIKNKVKDDRSRQVKLIEIFDRKYLPEKNNYSMLAMPLTYQNVYLGIVFFKANNIPINVYLQFQAQINSAIKSTFLLKEREKLLTDIKVKNKELNKALKSIYGEIELTKKIQTSILPKNYEIEGYKIIGYMKPAKEVGGDYFDVIRADKNSYWVNIGDVSGHGIDAGMIMLMLQTSVMTQILTNNNITPAQLIIEANKLIYYNCRNRLRRESYITSCFIKFNDAGEFTYSGAHLEILIFRDKTKTVEVIETSGFWLGILPDITKYIDENKFTMGKNDVLLIFTDGVIESFDKDKNIYSLERLINLLQKYGEKNPDFISKKLINDIDTFQKEQLDDYTFVILKKD